ncbi:MAG: anti-sigma factor domain-containing protein [Bacteroidia bacterium]
MDTAAYIASGTLELYVFGLLTEEENREVHDLALQHTEIAGEILDIEKAVINLSYAVSPKLSSANYGRIREQLIEKHSTGVVPLQPKQNNIVLYIGWAAAVVFMLGFGYQYMKYNEATEQVRTYSAKSSKYEQLLAKSEKNNIAKDQALAVLRDSENTIIKLEGQQAAPQAYAQVYMNKTNKEIYVDVAGLPEAPEGKVYQVWALKLDPLTPTSIGIIDNKNADGSVFKMENYDGPQAFGITLEPTGGSKVPTMAQLYTLGKV